MIAAAAVVTLAVPLAASAGTQSATVKVKPSYLSPALKDKLAKHPDETVSVIVQSSDGSNDAMDALTQVMGKKAKSLKQLNLVDGASVDIAANKLDDLLAIPGLTITPDSPVRLSGAADDPYQSRQLWPSETGNAFGWGNKDHLPAVAPTIAIVDSGIDANRADFGYGSRVVAQVNLTTLPGNSAGDGRGHGTFVAGIAAGSATNYAGASPTSNIVMLDVMDDQGMARTSDVIRAAQWIIANKAQYNIKVANFSLHSTTPSNFTVDPLDKAVEQLWFAGVTVVAAAGNYGVSTGPSGVLYAPGNDPFVITVGALDLGKSSSAGDDFTAPWSAYGYTYDGFMKPDVSAPGRYMVGPVPTGSTVVAERPGSVVAPGYMQLSGTSFAAPVVAGTAAQLLAAHPSWTPDMVKGALMATSRKVMKTNAPFSAGTGLITASKANDWPSGQTPPNPNLALDQYVRTVLGTTYFDGTSWYTTAQNNSSWDDVSWHSSAWSDVSWHSESGSDAAWTDVSWNSVSWHSVSWLDMVRADVVGDSTKEDAVAGDVNATGGVSITDQQFLQVLCDPSINPNPIPTTGCPVVGTTP